MAEQADPRTEALIQALLAADAGEPSESLRDRVGAIVRRAESRRRRPARIAVALLGALLIGHGLGGIFNGDWVAENLGAAYDSHPYFEAGVALVALGALLVAGGVSRRLLEPAALAGIPAGLALGINGASELGEFPAGGVLHLSEGVVALVLLVAIWRIGRYGIRLRPKEGYEG